MCPKGAGSGKCRENIPFRRFPCLQSTSNEPSFLPLVCARTCAFSWVLVSPHLLAALPVPSTTTRHSALTQQHVGHSYCRL